MNTKKILGLSKACIDAVKMPLLALALAFSYYTAQAEEPSYKPLRGLCYEASTNYTETEIKKDLSIIKNIAPKIKTPSNEGILFRIPEFCSDFGLYCYPGAHIDNLVGDDQQVSNLVEMANSGYVEGDDTPANSSIKGLVVGNDFLSREEKKGHSLSAAKTKIIDHINYVKANTTLPVTTSESWHIWNYDSSTDLVAAVDFIMLNLNPYKGSPEWPTNVAVDDAANYIVGIYNQIQQKYPGKNVIIGETGWSGDGQEKFLEDFTRLAKENNIDYLVFKAFDDASESYGILSSNRTLKPGCESLLQPKITGFDCNKIKIETYEGNPYSIESCDDIINPNWTNIINILGRAGANVTEAVLPAQSSLRHFYRAKTKI